MKPMQFHVTVCSGRPPAAIEATLIALAEQVEHRDDADLTLVSSTSDTAIEHRHAALASSLGAEHRTAVVGLSAARNVALAERDPASVVAFCDDDAVPQTDWLERLAGHWAREDKSVACIGGAIVPRLTAEAPAWMSPRLDASFSILDRGEGVLEIKPSSAEDVWGANVSFRCGPAIDAGGFDPRRGPWGPFPVFGDETDLERRLEAAGKRILYAGDVRVEHLIGADRMTLRSLWRREFYRGFGRAADGVTGTAAGAALALRAAGGTILAGARGNRKLAAVRFGRVALNTGIALAPVTERRLRRRGWGQSGISSTASAASQAAAAMLPPSIERPRALLISPGGTHGWRTNEAALAGSLRRLGLAPEVIAASVKRSRRLLRIWPLGAIAVALRARRATIEVLDAEGARPVALVVLVNSASALLAPWRRLRREGIPTAIRIDSPVQALWPGPAHALTRLLEQRALRRADLALATGPSSAGLVEPLARATETVPVALPPAPDVGEPGERDQPGNDGNERPDDKRGAAGGYAITYAGQPDPRGLDLVCAAWNDVERRRGPRRLVITGVARKQGERFLKGRGIDAPAGAEWAGELPATSYAATLAGAQLMVAAPRIEGHGIANLEALAAGVPLVSTSAAGAHEALDLARDLAPALVSATSAHGELADAIEAALDLSAGERASYARRARELAVGFGESAADKAMARALERLGVPAA